MATLEKIRSKAGLLVAVVGVALFAFIIGDFLNSGSTFFQQKKDVVLSVEGEKIGYQDFQAKIMQMEEVYKMQTGNSSLSEEITSQIRESVFESFVAELTMAIQSEKVGFTVSKDELSDLIMGDNISPIVQQMPMFRNQQTGVFDKNMLIQFLQTIESDEFADNAEIQGAKNFWLFYEQLIKQQKLTDKFTNLISKAIVANSLDAKAAFEASNISVDFDYVAQMYSTIADDQVTVSDSEIEKLYNKKKELYKQDEAVVINYIAVDIVPSQADYAAVLSSLEKIRPTLESSDNNVADIVNDNSDVAYTDVFMSTASMSPMLKNFVEGAAIGDVTQPILEGTIYHMYKLIEKSTSADSVKISQIALPNLEAAAMKQYTDSLINLVGKDKTFADLVTELTGGQTNGEMGWVTELSLLRASDEKFKNEVFNAPLNTPVVAQSTYGTHLIYVSEKTSPVTKYKVADVQIAVTSSSETYKSLFDNLTKYVAANKSLDAFKKNAEEAGYYCNTDVSVGKNDQTIGLVRSVRPVIHWAYEAKKGAVSDIFECQDKFVAVAVEGRQNEGYRPVSAVTEVLKRELINEKKGEKIIDGLKDKQYTSMEQYAEAMASSVRDVKFVNFATRNISGIGQEPVVTANAVLAEVGSISKPLKGLNGVYVLKIAEKRSGDAEFNLDTQKETLNAANFRFGYQAMQALREKSKIEDNRIRFF